MLIKYWMTKEVVTIEHDASMDVAGNLMKENNIAMLPVMKNGKLVGIVSDRDLKRAAASDATTLEIHELLYLISTIKVENIMTGNPITAPEDSTVEETAETLLLNKISSVPVVDQDGAIVGVISKSDIFRSLIRLTGFGKRGIQFAFEFADESGKIQDITDIVRNHGGRLVSVLSSYEGMPEGVRKVYIRAYGVDQTDMKDLEQSLKRKVTLLYLIDHRVNSRNIFSS